MCKETNHHRRRFLRDAVMTIAAAEFGMIGSADAQPSKFDPMKPGTNTSFRSLKQKPITDRQFEIEFLDPGAEAFVFTFG